MAGNSERRRPSLNDLASLAGRTLPGPALKLLLGSAIHELGVSLCLHRVAARPRPTDWQGGLSMPAFELDALLELLLSSRPGPSRDWLRVSFDDGYRDAGEYLRTRAPQFPQVQFDFFICPEKAEARAGFRWDLVEQRDRDVALLDTPPDVERENRRPELRALAEHPDFALCTLEELRELGSLPNVTLGNHTSLHLSSARFPDAVIKADFERSTATFTRHFGPPENFAFPYGTPRFHFERRHVDWLRTLGSFPIWTTEARPYRVDELRPGGVLPRFPVDGRQSAQSLAGWVAARSLAFRARGTKHHYD